METRHFFDDPRNVKRVLRAFYAVCALLAGIDLVFHRHVIHSWESLVWFYPIFGFVACVVLVLTAKEMRRIVMRREDYYDW